jgi:hypothetical protein
MNGAKVTTREDVLALLPKAKKFWDDNPPPPPSKEAAELAQRLIRITVKMPDRSQCAEEIE